MSDSRQGTKWTSSSGSRHGALSKTAPSLPHDFPLAPSRLRAGSPALGPGRQRSHQPAMLKTTSNELDHCPYCRPAPQG